MTGKNGHKRFEVPIRTAKLVFEGEYAGAEVRCRLDVPMGMYLRYAAMSSDSPPEDIRKAFEDFSREILLEWNLDIEGHPVPVEDGLLRVPATFAMRILEVWAEEAKKSPLAVIPSSS